MFVARRSWVKSWLNELRILISNMSYPTNLKQHIQNGQENNLLHGSNRYFIPTVFNLTRAGLMCTKQRQQDIAGNEHNEK
mmetsp:Transcript_17698/g.31997  ORF Transcript_17698/g.31997 Transcript_17698/m.31997 type:complete len:80 (+) Transcript_17698:311-550(+)